MSGKHSIKNNDNKNVSSNNEQEKKESNEELDKLKKEVEELKNLLKEKEIHIKEEEDKYLRMFAEFENYKQRTKKEKMESYNMAKKDIIQNILPVIDAIDSATKTKEEDGIKGGLNLVLKMINDFLNKSGIEEIDTKDTLFDPKYHEAVGVLENPEKEEGTILEQYRKGYKIGDKVIRHSMVIVSKK